MTQYERELSNLSYTNKDFGQIYPELLDLAKKISYKWDPTTSDESDPGVVLLKLAALMADKNNYNIDKNILELFPLSVTQETNARQIFDQCGYCMKYYQSATTKVSLTLVSEPEITDSDKAILSPTSTDIDLDDPTNIRTYTLPIFTMVSDIDNNIIYTLVEPASLKSDGVTVAVNAMQGVATEYNINGENLITSTNLDYNNRLYFTEKDIAENGIFIQNVGKDNYEEWIPVDNLIIQPLNSTCYKFGLTEDGNTCYIEFPSDIDNIIGNGLNITYIRTSGLEGNIGRKRLAQFYVDTTAERHLVYDAANVQEVAITSQNIYITNTEAASNGKNPETIDQAYRNYQKVKNTFETLVSLKDYTDFLYTNKNVSNGYVCDRTNDIESCYKILESNNDYSKTHTIIKDRDDRFITTITKNPLTGEESEVKEAAPELDPFDLRIYGLTYVDDPTTADNYAKSFTLLQTDDSVANDMYKLKQSLRELKCIQHNFQQFIPNRILMIKNKYYIQSKIIPQYKITPGSTQESDIKKKIIHDLFQVLNARAVDFGAEVQWDLIYDTIAKADPRIKAVVLNDIKYETYAVYFDGKDIREMRIDHTAIQHDDHIEYVFGYEPPKNTETSNDGDLWHQFRTEIYAKSVLAGKTQLLNPDNTFTYSLQQRDSTLCEDIYYISTNTDIDVPFDKVDEQPTSEILKENENVIFTAPNLIKDQDYSSYVKFLHNIGGTQRDEASIKEIQIPANGDYTLKDNEYIIFFWKAQDDENAPYQYYKYSGKSNIKIISPTFTLKIQEEVNTKKMPTLPDLSGWPDGRGTTELKQIIGSKLIENNNGDFVSTIIEVPATEYITDLQGAPYVLSGTNSITTKKLNTIHVNNTSNGTNNVYWILNKNVNDKAVLFEKGSREYTLQTGEYFLYSNAAKTQLVMLGSGTKIERSVDGEAWSVDKVDYDDFVEESIDYLETKWFTIPRGVDVYATEMQFYQLGPGNRIKLIDLKESRNPKLKIVRFHNSGTRLIYANNTEAEVKTLEDFRISYIDESGAENYLPLRNDPATAWRGKSLLNINCSPDKPQTLTKNQSLTPYTIDIIDEVETQVELDPITGFTLLPDREVVLTGGVNIDSTYLDLITQQPIPLKLYVYNPTQVSDTDAWSFTGFNTNLFVNKAGTYTLEFSLPVGHYILTINVGEPWDVLEASYTSENGIKQTLADIRTLETDLSKKGIYYLNLDIEGDNMVTGTLEIKATPIPETIENSKKTNTIGIAPLYKYNCELLSKNNPIASFYEMTKLINSLDPSHVFIYTYIVPEEDKIDDPLVSESFVNSNHIFNPFTICEWNIANLNQPKIDSNKLTLVSKIK